MERFLEGHAANDERFLVTEFEGYCMRVEAMAGSYAAAGGEEYKVRSIYDTIGSISTKFR